MTREITIRTASGREMERVKLVSERSIGASPTHNGETRFPRLIGEDADGTLYETTSRRGWRRALDQDATRRQLHG
jgi:hypothetical protein